jgi:hypothetical protein
VAIFEGLHDMSRPADAPRAARRLLTPSGSVVIADELVADVFTAPASDLERYHYGWNMASCLPDAMGEPATAAAVAVMRPATLATARAGEILYEGADACYIPAHDQRLHRLGALERVQRLDVRQMADDMVLEQDAVAAQQVSGLRDHAPRAGVAEQSLPVRGDLQGMVPPVKLHGEERSSEGNVRVVTANLSEPGALRPETLKGQPLRGRPFAFP